MAATSSLSVTLAVLRLSSYAFLSPRPKSLSFSLQRETPPFSLRSRAPKSLSFSIQCVTLPISPRSPTPSPSRVTAAAADALGSEQTLDATSSGYEDNSSGPAPSLPDVEADADKEATFDVKLPRRNLLVEFTCDSCGERTKRLINRVAYEKGTIFLQVYHKFVDNLGLVVEYDLREELVADSDDT